MPDETFASSGNKPIAERLYKQAGVTAQDIDVALLYDHFTPMVLMQLEDYGFCEKGEGGAFVESGAIRYSADRKAGNIPVNTHGGQLSEAYIIGMRSEEHTSELQSLMRISYAVFCLKKK